VEWGVPGTAEETASRPTVRPASLGAGSCQRVFEDRYLSGSAASDLVRGRPPLAPANVLGSDPFQNFVGRDGVASGETPPFSVPASPTSWARG
jgi:hypothetical protein